MASQSDVLKAENTFPALLSEVALTTDEFSLVDLSGGNMSQASLIQAVGSGQLRFDAIEPVEAMVRFYGPAGVDRRLERRQRRSL